MFDHYKQHNCSQQIYDMQEDDGHAGGSCDDVNALSKPMLWIREALRHTKNKPSIELCRSVCIADAVVEMSERFRKDPRRYAFGFLLRLNEEARCIRKDAELSRNSSGDGTGNAVINVKPADCSPFGIGIDVVAHALRLYHKYKHLHTESETYTASVYRALHAMASDLDALLTDSKGFHVFGDLRTWSLGTRGKHVHSTCAVSVSVALLCRRSMPFHLPHELLQKIVSKLSVQEKVLDSVIKFACAESERMKFAQPPPAWVRLISPVCELRDMHNVLISSNPELLALLCEIIGLEDAVPHGIDTKEPMDVDDPMSVLRIYSDKCFMLRYLTRRLPKSAQAAADQVVELSEDDKRVRLFPEVYDA